MWHYSHLLTYMVSQIASFFNLIQKIIQPDCLLKKWIDVSLSSNGIVDACYTYIIPSNKKPLQANDLQGLKYARRDSNPKPSGPKPDALSNWATGAGEYWILNIEQGMYEVISLIEIQDQYIWICDFNPETVYSTLQVSAGFTDPGVLIQPGCNPDQITASNIKIFLKIKNTPSDTNFP